MDTRHAKSRTALAVALLVAVTTLSLFTAAIADASVLSKRRAGAEALKAARYIAKDDPNTLRYGYGGCERRNPHRVACLAIVTFDDRDMGRYQCTARIVSRLHHRTGRVSSHYADGSANCVAEGDGPWWE